MCEATVTRLETVTVTMTLDEAREYLERGATAAQTRLFARKLRAAIEAGTPQATAERDAIAAIAQRGRWPPHVDFT